MSKNDDDKWEDPDWLAKNLNWFCQRSEFHKAYANEKIAEKAYDKMIERIREPDIWRKLKNTPPVSVEERERISHNWQTKHDKRMEFGKDGQPLF
jgi:hypothetical protein